MAAGDAHRSSNFQIGKRGMTESGSFKSLLEVIPMVLRYLALMEFRIGCLEYEFVEGDTNLISVHIPSDADLRKNSVEDSEILYGRKC